MTTTNMRNAIEQAAYEIGVATAKYEMAIEGAKLTIGDELTFRALEPRSMAGVFASGIGPKSDVASKRVRKAAKVSVTRKYMLAEGDPGYSPKAPKAPVMARGVKQTRGPRTKGVKQEIVRMIVNDAMTVDQIIKSTGFKENSVRATLMGLKKKGVANNDGNLWSASVAASYDTSGNSDHASAEV